MIKIIIGVILANIILKFLNFIYKIILKKFININLKNVKLKDIMSDIDSITKDKKENINYEFWDLK